MGRLVREAACSVIAVGRLRLAGVDPRVQTQKAELAMPGGWDSYGQAIAADGPVGWYRFNELLAGSAVAAGSQDPQNFCFDSSMNGNRNQAVPPFPSGNFLQYGSAVLANQSSLLVTNGITSTVTTGDPGGSALFPSTGTASTINIAT